MGLIGISNIEIDRNCRIIPGIDDVSKLEPKDLPKDILAGIKELAESIEETGLVQPIAIKEMSPGKYRLIAGWRRLMAHKLMGKTMIDTTIKKGKREDESTMQLVENLQRQNLAPMEVAQTLERIREEKKFTTQDQLSKYVHMSPAFVSQHMSLLKADPAVQDALKKGEIGIGSARAVTALPKGEQKKAIAAAKKEAEKSGDKDKKTGKVKVKVKGVRRQARKSKAKAEKKADKKAGKIRPVAERSKEQGQFMIQSFFDEELGQKKPSKPSLALVEKFWSFLMKKNRLVIR